MQRIKQLKNNFNILNIVLSLNLYYYSYRYLLQYNSSSTSPSYGDTPAFLKWSKYILLAFVISKTILDNHGLFYVRKCHKDIKILLFFLVCQFGFYGVFVFNVFSFKFLVSFFPIFFFLGKRVRVDLAKIEKTMLHFWAFTVVYELIQIALYVAIGRLPALGYPSARNLFFVRFGGAWDDPNGYALLMSFYVFYFLLKYKGWLQMLHLFFAFIMLLLTWSGTGMLALMATAFVIGFLRLGDRWFINKFFKIGIATLLLLSLVFILNYSFIIQEIEILLQSKRESIAAHLTGWDTSEMNILTWFGLYPNEEGGEIGYMRLLSIVGIPGLIVFLLVSIKAIISMNKKIKQSPTSRRPLLYGLLAFMICFMVANFNLPLIDIFSVVGIFSCCLMISFSNLWEDQHLSSPLKCMGKA